MTDLLVTGSEGQLGRALLAAAAARGLTAEGHDIDTLDITDAAAVRELVTWLRPAVLVNCAAFTAVDECEAREAEATAINGTAVGYLAGACDLAGATLVQISTDYVFSGEEDRPYREDDPPAPVNAYGRSKLRGEELAASARQHLIVRTAWLYGEGGRSFVEAIRGQIAAGRTELEVVHDQRGCPTYAADLAEAILDLVAAGARGIVHAVSTGDASWYELAVEIVRLLGAGVRVVPVPTSRVPRPARRPRNSVLDTTRLRSLLGRPLPHWRDALARYLGEASCAP